MGVDQPGGAGNVIYFYDDSDPWIDLLQTVARTPGPYTYAQIKLGMDTLRPGQTDYEELNTTGRKTFRSNVTLSHGDAAGGPATTTLTETNVDLIIAYGKFYQYSGALGSYFTNWGTKVGTVGWKDGCSVTHLGAQSFSVKGTVKAYGTRFVQNGGGFNPLVESGGGSEMIGCQITNQTTGNVGTLGTTANKWAQIVDTSYSGGSIITSVNNVGSDALSLITISVAAPTSFLAPSLADLSYSDITFNGTPTLSDVRGASSSFSLRHKHIRPYWSLNAPKFTHAGTGSMSLANAHSEWWAYRCKVTLAGGLGVANIPVKLTDTLGNIQVNTTTDSSGEISFGSGITAQMIRVMDFYSTAGVINLSHRSPFLLEVNTGASLNSSYSSFRYYFYWPGYETVTNTAGRFRDVNDVIPLQQASGAPTSWIEKEMP